MAVMVSGKLREVVEVGRVSDRVMTVVLAS